MNFYSSNPLVLLRRVFRDGSKAIKATAAVAIMFAFLGFALTTLPLGEYILERFGQLLLALAAIIWLFIDSGFRAIEQEKIEERIDRAEQAIVEHPEKTRPLWDLARSRLELYFERNLSQIKSIFWITLIVMAAGFVMIGYGINKAFDNQSINASLLAAASGVLTEFISVTFLFIYRSTMSQASDYVRTLERINAVGMSMQILDSIPDSEAELKNKVRADLVTNILDAFISNGNKQRPNKSLKSDAA